MTDSDAGSDPITPGDSRPSEPKSGHIAPQYPLVRSAGNGYPGKRMRGARRAHGGQPAAAASIRPARLVLRPSFAR